MSRLDKLAKALVNPINPSAVVILGVYTVVWGFWVANPFWDVFTQAELYGVLAQVAPEFVWGIAAIIVGLITIRGALKPSYNNLIQGALAAWWHWMMIAVFYFMGDPLNTGGITCVFFAIYAAYIYLNIRVNYKDNSHDSSLMQ